MNHHWTTVIAIHAIAAFSCVLIGALVFFNTKGTPLHRWLGRVWGVLMLVVIFSSFGIQSSGHFSWIHGLSIWALVVLALGIRHIRQGRISAHWRTMRGLYIGLSVAFVFTLLPYRLLGNWVWGSLGLI